MLFSALSVHHGVETPHGELIGLVWPDKMNYGEPWRNMGKNPGRPSNPWVGGSNPSGRAKKTVVVDVAQLVRAQDCGS